MKFFDKKGKNESKKGEQGQKKEDVVRTTISLKGRAARIWKKLPMRARSAFLSILLDFTYSDPKYQPLYGLFTRRREEEEEEEFQYEKKDKKDTLLPGRGTDSSKREEKKEDEEELDFIKELEEKFSINWINGGNTSLIKATAEKIK